MPSLGFYKRWPRVMGNPDHELGAFSDCFATNSTIEEATIGQVWPRLITFVEYCDSVPPAT